MGHTRLHEYHRAVFNVYFVSAMSRQLEARQSARLNPYSLQKGLLQCYKGTQKPIRTATSTTSICLLIDRGGTATHRIVRVRTIL
jgi:hypothetical protein